MGRMTEGEATQGTLEMIVRMFGSTASATGGRVTAVELGEERAKLRVLKG